MAATREEIKRWLESAKKNHTHMLVVCDTYDWYDYPVYVSESEDVKEVEKRRSQNMQRVMEVYKLDLSFDDQLNEYRVFNY